jgi:hypothetical protein
VPPVIIEGCKAATCGIERCPDFLLPILCTRSRDEFFANDFVAFILESSFEGLRHGREQRISNRIYFCIRGKEASLHFVPLFGENDFRTRENILCIFNFIIHQRNILIN